MSQQREQHHEWLKQGLESASQNVNQAFLALLKQLHSADPRMSDSALAELWRRADEFGREILVCYRILTAELEARTQQENEPSYSWYHLAFLDAILSMKSKTHRDKAIYILEQGLQHPHEGMRQCIIGRLEVEVRRGNKRARAILWQALEHTFESPEITQRYHQSILKALEHEP